MRHQLLLFAIGCAMAAQAQKAPYQVGAGASGTDVFLNGAYDVGLSRAGGI